MYGYGYWYMYKYESRVLHVYYNLKILTIILTVHCESLAELKQTKIASIAPKKSISYGSVKWAFLVKRNLGIPTWWHQFHTFQAYNKVKILISEIAPYTTSLTLQSFESVCQTRTVWSLEHEASREPSVEMRTIRTHSRWPLYVFTQYPVVTSQALMVLSRLPENTRSPLGAKATEDTLWSWPCMVLMHSYVCWKSHSFIDMSALHETGNRKETL